MQSLRIQIRSWLVLWVSGVGCVGTALAEDGVDAGTNGFDEPERAWLVPGPPMGEKRPGWFHLDRFDGYLEFESLVEQQRRRRRTGGRFREEYRQRNVDWMLREQVGFDLAGDIGHPNWFSFEGGFALGLEHDYFRESTETYVEEDYDTGFLTEFDVVGRFLQGGAFHGDVYARRSQNRIPRRFLPSIDEDRTLFGVNLFLRSDIIPMRFTLEREMLDWDGGADPFDEEETRENRLVYELDVLFSEYNQLHFLYEYNNLHEEFSGYGDVFRTRRHQFTLDHELRFGDERQHRLDTSLRYQEEEGDLARDEFEFNPRLTLRHAPNLTSFLSYEFLHEQYDQIGFESHRGDYTLEHVLYKSLTTRMNVFGQHEEFDDGLNATTYGGGAQWTYVKNNPLGTFRTEIGYQWDQRKEYDGEGLYVQTRESGTFRDPRPIYLTHTYAVLSSILVTSPDRSRFYVVGRDYVVSQVRNRAAVHRLPTGRIADGDSVLINYTYRRLTRSRIDNQRVDVRVEQRFDLGLRPYYEFNFRNQEIRQPIAFPFEEDNVRRHRVGVDYVRDRWSVGFEYEREDNAYDPFDAVHANGQWSLYRDVRLDTAVSANYSRFYFDSFDNRDVDLLDLGWDTSWTIDPRTSASLLTAYRWENDSVDGVTHGVDLTATLAHRIGQTEIEMTAEYDLLEFDESADDGFSFWLRVRRNFGALLR